jgi:hypothetical protein
VPSRQVLRPGVRSHARESKASSRAAPASQSSAKTTPSARHLKAASSSPSPPTQAPAAVWLACASPRTAACACDNAPLARAPLATKPRGTDPCLADSRRNPQHCGVLGVDDKPTLVCLPAGAGREGDACSLFPVTGKDPEACGLNVTEGQAPGLPLVCMNESGNATGTLKCRIAACTGAAGECASGGICNGSATTTPPFQFCKSLAEQ